MVLTATEFESLVYFYLSGVTINKLSIKKEIKLISGIFTRNIFRRELVFRGK